MHDLAPVLVFLFMTMGIMIPYIVKMVLRHQKELAVLQYPQAQQTNTPALVGEVQELRKQVADMRELLMDIALSSPSPSIQERVRTQEITGGK